MTPVSLLDEPYYPTALSHDEPALIRPPTWFHEASERNRVGFEPLVLRLCVCDPRSIQIFTGSLRGICGIQSARGRQQVPNLLPQMSRRPLRGAGLAIWSQPRVTAGSKFLWDHEVSIRF
jgi:hypothetical protein